MSAETSGRRGSAPDPPTSDPERLARLATCRLGTVVLTVGFWLSGSGSETAHASWWSFVAVS